MSTLKTNWRVDQICVKNGVTNVELSHNKKAYNATSYHLLSLTAIQCEKKIQC